MIEHGACGVAIVSRFRSALETDPLTAVTEHPAAGSAWVQSRIEGPSVAARASDGGRQDSRKREDAKAADQQVIEHRALR